jgi:hypothetical protein
LLWRTFRLLHLLVMGLLLLLQLLLELGLLLLQLLLKGILHDLVLLSHPAHQNGLLLRTPLLMLLLLLLLLMHPSLLLLLDLTDLLLHLLVGLIQIPQLLLLSALAHDVLAVLLRGPLEDYNPVRQRCNLHGLRQRRGCHGRSTL